MKQRHAYADIVLHLIFSTARRQPLLSGIDRERFLKRLIVSKSRELDAYVYACGAAMDHVHILFSVRPSLAPERYLHDIKGATAWIWNREHGNEWGRLAWQDGYWIQSVTPAGFESLREYIENQRRHHENKVLNMAWEMPATDADKQPVQGLHSGS